MFIQTEPELFHGMLRVRVGLIIEVMTQEVGRRSESKLFAASLVRLPTSRIFYPSSHILPGSFISAVKISGTFKIATNYDTALDFNDT